MNIKANVFIIIAKILRKTENRQFVCVGRGERLVLLDCTVNLDERVRDIFVDFGDDSFIPGELVIYFGEVLGQYPYLTKVVTEFEKIIAAHDGEFALTEAELESLVELALKEKKALIPVFEQPRRLG